MVSPLTTSATPIAVLIDELRSEDVKRKVNSAKHLFYIANAIGPDRTKNELIPFITSGNLQFFIIFRRFLRSLPKFCNLEMLEDEDEVLLALAETIPSLSDIVGSGNLLLPALEKLCYAEDITVREKVLKHRLQQGFTRVYRLSPDLERL